MTISADLQVEKMMKALRDGGGLIISERQTGKTTALLKFMMETKHCVLVIPSQCEEERVRRMWYDLNGASLPRQAGDLIVHPPKIQIRVGYRLQEGLDLFRGGTPETKVLVDEYFLCGYRGPFYAATATIESGTVVVPFHGGR